MQKFRVLFTPLAESDVLEQASWYESQVDTQLADRWTAGVDAALERIARAPRSLRPGITVDRFPEFLIFYQLRNDAVLVLRVLHGARDRKALV